MAQTKNENITNEEEQIEEIRPIVITDNKTGEVYTLEFNAESVRFAEQKDFLMDDIVTKPVSKIPELFYYAFRMHHKYLPKDKINKIYDEIMPLPQTFVARLKDLYYIPLTEMFESRGEEKNERMTIQM